jgi:small-conductance mechanosensitive channel
VILICSLIIRNFIETLSATIVFENSFLAKKYFPLIIKLISIGAFILWLSAFLKAFGIFPFFQQFFTAFWNLGGTFGEFSVSVGDVASIILTIVISFILAEFIQVLLEKEVFSRFKVARGIPMAIGVMGKYFIITTGFFLAIASTGFDITKISLIAGALGVGIGFGLQNLVANFVSGMILIFERPILVGDIVEAEGVEGQITQIGVRASKMLTYEGAEVVIPNSNLINNKVSNWTLSNRKRRFTFNVYTNKNANPSEVVSIITTIALNNVHIIKDPAPFVIFQGQSEQSLLFNVYYWQVGELLRTRSELNLAIYEELKAKGIEISIPVFEIKKIE